MASFRKELQIVLLRVIQRAKKVDVQVSEAIAPGEALVRINCHEVVKILKEMVAEEEKLVGREQAEADLKEQMMNASMWNFVGNTCVGSNSVELISSGINATRELRSKEGTALLKDLGKKFSWFEENELKKATADVTTAITVLQQVEVEIEKNKTGLKEEPPKNNVEKDSEGSARERGREREKPQTVEKKDSEGSRETEEKNNVEKDSDGSAREREREGETPQTVEKKDGAQTMEKKDSDGSGETEEEDGKHGVWHAVWEFLRSLFDW